ncbi:LOW QUALITY PROTEIN: hypothetical protein NC653_024142 [Populus alba x Populus x berolinensis]|uniref:non-specific serine/threonine protein kinase n=1 Tax=Populus alba x Populus x berolinensis TaxID=444605 RepID=A0AAD6M919_9ROSI|nr:LOW QUALITY PROTEIN: hypothetical protein NC653_024142 [Populus alba x Populus x berolinensis]
MASFPWTQAVVVLKQYFKQTKATSSGAAKLPCLAKLHNQSEWYFERSKIHFTNYLEQEMHIGFATDVKYVAHIGWYGPMNEFTSPQRNFKWDFKFDRCEEPFNRFKPWKGQTEKPMTLVQGSSSEFLSASSLLNSPDRRKYRLIKALLAPRHLYWSSPSKTPPVALYAPKSSRRHRSFKKFNGLSKGRLVREQSNLKTTQDLKSCPESPIPRPAHHPKASRGRKSRGAHPWFEGIEWDTLYQMKAAFIPEVNDELDTQNFEKFEEADDQIQTSAKSGPWRKMLSSKDINFVGYTYKNFEIVNDHQLPGIAELKKRSTKSKRPSIKSLFEDESAEAPNQPVKGSFLSLLPPKPDASEQSCESKGKGTPKLSGLRLLIGSFR